MGSNLEELMELSEGLTDLIDREDWLAASAYIANLPKGTLRDPFYAVLAGALAETYDFIEPIYSEDEKDGPNNGIYKFLFEFCLRKSQAR